MTNLWTPGNHILGAGVVYFDDGDGERPIIETSQLDLVVEPESIQRWGSVNGPLHVVDSRITRVRRTINTGSTDIIWQNLAMFFGATYEEVDPGSSFSADSTAAGLFYQCAAFPTPFVTGPSVTFDNNATPVAGTHYEVDAARGRIQVLQDGLGGMDVTFTTDTMYRLDLQPQDEVRGGLRFLADPTAGEGWDLWFPEVVIRPQGPISWKSRADWTRIGLEIEILGAPSSSVRQTMAAT